MAEQKETPAAASAGQTPATKEQTSPSAGQAPAPERQTPPAPRKGPNKAPPPGMAARRRPPEAAAKKQKKKKSQAPAGNAGESQENLGNLGAVIVRNEFYRDGYRSLLRLAVIQSIVIVGLIGIMFFVINIHQPENRFFATTEDGRLIPMVPLNQPNLSSPALMSWVAQASVETMTFGFSDYRRRLQESSRNFTKSGWESFTSALERSRILEMVEENQQIVTSAPAGAPIIQREGIVQGRYQWTIQVPLMLSFQSGTKSQVSELLVTIVVVRVPRLENPNGIGIEQWIAVAR